MCGRYTLTTKPKVLVRHFALNEVSLDIPPRFNVAPTQQMPVIRQFEERRRLDMMRWGLVPSWAKDLKLGYRMINARAETVATKPAFRAAFRHRRCLIPADDFYEWRKEDGQKQPYWIGLRDRKPFAFAGLWESRVSRDTGEVVESFTIIVTDANQVVSAIHDCMPVILPPAAYGQWLDPDEQDPSHLKKLLLPYPTDEIIAYAISREVNNPRNDYADLLRPVEDYR